MASKIRGKSPFTNPELDPFRKLTPEEEAQMEAERQERHLRYCRGRVELPKHLMTADLSNEDLAKLLQRRKQHYLEWMAEGMDRAIVQILDEQNRQG
jgi:hypothetical protein